MSLAADVQLALDLEVPQEAEPASRPTAAGNVLVMLLEQHLPEVARRPGK